MQRRKKREGHKGQRLIRNKSQILKHATNGSCRECIQTVKLAPEEIYARVKQRRNIYRQKNS